MGSYLILAVGLFWFTAGAPCILYLVNSRTPQGFKLVEFLDPSCFPEGPGTSLLRNQGLKTVIIIVFGPKSLIIKYLGPLGLC